MSTNRRMDPGRIVYSQAYQKHRLYGRRKTGASDDVNAKRINSAWLLVSVLEKIFCKCVRAVGTATCSLAAASTNPVHFTISARTRRSPAVNE